MDENHHDKYSPSKLYHWATCPHWDSAGGGPEAQRGTRIHKAVATGDMTGLDADEIHAARRCIKFLYQFRADNPEWAIQQEVWLPGVIEDTGGSADVLATYQDMGVVIDWKGSDTDPNSAQGKAYALHAMAAKGLHKVGVVFFNYTSGLASDSATYTSQADLAFEIASIKEHRITAEKCPSMYSPIPSSSCCWCKKKSTCKEASAMTANELTVVSADAIDIHAMSIQQAGDMYSKLNALLKRAKKIEDALKERLVQETESGIATGYRVSERASKRDWVDNSIVSLAKTYTEANFLEEPDFYDLKSPAELEREMILSFGISHTEAIQEMIASAVTQYTYKVLTKEK